MTTLPPTSASVAASAHPVIGPSPSAAHHAVAPAAAPPRGAVVGAGSLHAHGLPLGLVVGPHLSAAALEDLNVPGVAYRRHSEHSQKMAFVHFQ